MSCTFIHLRQSLCNCRPGKDQMTFHVLKSRTLEVKGPFQMISQKRGYLEAVKFTVLVDDVGVLFLFMVLFVVMAFNIHLTV